jgi:hypothetical protein
MPYRHHGSPKGDSFAPPVAVVPRVDSGLGRAAPALPPLEIVRARPLFDTGPGEMRVLTRT